MDWLHKRNHRGKSQVLSRAVWHQNMVDITIAQNYQERHHSFTESPRVGANSRHITHIIETFLNHMIFKLKKMPPKQTKKVIVFILYILQKSKYDWAKPKLARLYFLPRLSNKIQGLKLDYLELYFSENKLIALILWELSW